MYHRVSELGPLPILVIEYLPMSMILIMITIILNSQVHVRYMCHKFITRAPQVQVASTMTPVLHELVLETSFAGANMTQSSHWISVIFWKYVQSFYNIQHNFYKNVSASSYGRCSHTPGHNFHVVLFKLKFLKVIGKSPTNRQKCWVCEESSNFVPIFFDHPWP